MLNFQEESTRNAALDEGGSFGAVVTVVPHGENGRTGVRWSARHRILIQDVSPCDLRLV